MPLPKAPQPQPAGGGSYARANNPGANANTSCAYANNPIAYANNPGAHANALCAHANISIAHANTSCAYANAPGARANALHPGVRRRPTRKNRVDVPPMGKHPRRKRPLGRYGKIGYSVVESGELRVEGGELRVQCFSSVVLRVLKKMIRNTGSRKK